MRNPALFLQACPYCLALIVSALRSVRLWLKSLSYTVLGYLCDDVQKATNKEAGIVDGNCGGLLTKAGGAEERLELNLMDGRRHRRSEAPSRLVAL